MILDPAEQTVEKWVFLQKTSNFLQTKKGVFEWTLQETARKFQEGFRAQESRTLANFHKIKGSIVSRTCQIVSSRTFLVQLRRFGKEQKRTQQDKGEESRTFALFLCAFDQGNHNCPSFWVLFYPTFQSVKVPAFLSCVTWLKLTKTD